MIQTSRGLGIPKESDQKAVGITTFVSYRVRARHRVFVDIARNSGRDRARSVDVARRHGLACAVADSSGGAEFSPWNEVSVNPDSFTRSGSILPAINRARQPAGTGSAMEPRIGTGRTISTQHRYPCGPFAYTIRACAGKRAFGHNCNTRKHVPRIWRRDPRDRCEWQGVAGWCL